ncbi:MAG: rod shape-determining protein MreD [Alphaproteobacteria bacterium]|nr:rod shape-determining protein MreD [Alphaproteobacteria bacterium]
MDQLARNLLPVLLTLALVLVSAVPTRLPGFSAIAPMLTLIGVCYWSIARPDLMRPVVALGIGIFQDVLLGTPLGVDALVLVVAQGVLVSQQRFFFGKPFFVWWWAFGLIAAGAVILKWVLVAALYGRVVEPAPVVFSYLVTVSLYPGLGWLFARVESALIKEG